MSNRLGQFVEKISTDKLLQQTYFKVEFNFSGAPAWLSKLTSSVNDSNSFDIYVQGTTLPGKRISTLELKKHNITIRMPGNVEYDGTWTCELLIDNKLINYRALLAWQNYYSSVARSGGGERGFPVATAKIYILDSYYNTVDKGKLVQTLYGVYPTNVPELTFSQEGNEYIKPSIEFAYSWSDDVGLLSQTPGKSGKFINDAFGGILNNIL